MLQAANLPVLGSIPRPDPGPLLSTAGIPQELVVRVDPLVNDPLWGGSGGGEVRGGSW